MAINYGTIAFLGVIIVGSLFAQQISFTRMYEWLTTQEQDAADAKKTADAKKSTDAKKSDDAKKSADEKKK